jgi:hypothetical protein
MVSVVARGDAFAEYAINRETDRAGHHDGVAFERRRARCHSVFRSENGDACESQCDTREFAPGRFLDAKNHGERQRVDRRHANDHGAMAYGRVIEAERETHLIDDNAEESEIEKSPEITRSESTSASF